MTLEEGSERYHIAGFEDGGRHCKPKNAGGLGKMEKVREQPLP